MAKLSRHPSFEDASRLCVVVLVVGFVWSAFTGLSRMPAVVAVPFSIAAVGAVLGIASRRAADRI